MKEYKFNDTEILVDNELCRWWSARNKDLSCLKTLTVLHKKNNYTFSFGQQVRYWQQGYCVVTTSVSTKKKFCLKVI